MYVRTAAPGVGGVGFLDPVTASLLATGVSTAATAIWGWVNARNRSKVLATQVVDEAERHLQQNLAAYQAAPYADANRRQALDNFEQVWAVVLQGCSDPSLGSAGRRCISERQRGGQWDWFARYRDPIENDPRAAEAAASSSYTPFVGSSAGPGFNLSDFALPGALLLAGALL